jgi:hypothetical protein
MFSFIKKKKTGKQKGFYLERGQDQREEAEWQERMMEWSEYD